MVNVSKRQQPDIEQTTAEGHQWVFNVARITAPVAVLQLAPTNIYTSTVIMNVETMSKQLDQRLTALRISLIGRTGVGKSKTGNTILNDKDAFKFGSQGSSLTQECELRTGKRFGRQISLVDTPGLCDTNTKNQNVLKEIERCVSLLTPGPHVFVLVLTVGRVTNQDLEAINLFTKHFGKKFFKHVIICITRFDDWKRETEDKGDSIPCINDFISSLPDKLRKIVSEECKNRAVAFDNTLIGPKIESQVQYLLSIIDSAVFANDMNYYSFQDLKSAEEQNRKEVEKHSMLDRVLIEREVLKRQNEMMAEIRKEQHQKYKEYIRQKQKALRRQQRLNDMREVLEVVGTGASIGLDVLGVVLEFI